MKNFFGVVVLMLIVAASVQAEVVNKNVLVPPKDYIASDINGEGVLSTEEIQIEKAKIQSFFKKYHANEFVGHVQYVLSSLNLSLRTNAIYDVEDNGTVLFHLATAGNHHVAAGDVTFPMQARVYVELKSAEGGYQKVNMDGVIRELKPRKNVFYLLETEQGFKERNEVQTRRIKGPNLGQFVAEVEYDMFFQKIRFYEIAEGKEVLQLVRKGTFTGNLAPARRGW